MDKIFADGFYWDRREDAPDFVVGRISVKAEAAIPFLKEHANDRGYVNLDVKQAKSGTFYVELDTWTPKQGDAQKAAQVAAASTAAPSDDIPFMRAPDF